MTGSYASDRLTAISTYIETLPPWTGENVAANAWKVYAAALEYHVSQYDVTDAINKTSWGAGITFHDVNALFTNAGVPMFDQGINYLPDDMLIQAHKGERIFPAADNALLMQRLQSPQANNEALVAEIRALRAEVASLRVESSAENRASITSTNKIGTLLYRAMPDGDALATRAAT
jgi:hypothetical protein